jgi:hypothetical protein
MTTKCNCNNCSAHLEFDSAIAGQAITCPTCGMETTLYVPQAPPLPKVEKPLARSSEPIANPLGAPTSPAESLRQIRLQTCYKTLRGLVDLVQILFFVAAGLVVLGSIGVFFAGGEDLPFGGKILYLLIALALAFILVVLGIAWKQAALLLVDIADCQIRLAGRT